MKAMVIHSNQEYCCFDWVTGLLTPFPPIGAIGEVISEEDADGELEVLFEDYPHPAINDPGWIVHKSMIVFLRENDAKAFDRIAELSKHLF